MNTSLWFYSDTQQTYGPVTVQQLTAMIQAGQLTAGHFIMTQGGQEWQSVASSPFAAYLPMAPAAPAVAPAAFGGAAKPAAPAATKPATAKPAGGPQKPVMRPAGQPAPRQPVNKSAATRPAPASSKHTKMLVFGTLGVLALALGWNFLTPKPPQVRTLTKRLEGETLKVLQVTGGEVETQPMKQTNALWSGDAHLFWQGGAANYNLDLEFNVEPEQAGRQRLKAAFTSSYDYGIVEVSVDGRKLKDKIFDLQANGAVISGARDLGLHDLLAGPHVLRIGILDTSVINMDKREAYKVGLDYLQLEPPVLEETPAAPGTNIASKAQPSAGVCIGRHVSILSNTESTEGRKSGDDKERFTWYPSKGNAEWAQYEWNSPQAINECRIFWFDGTNLRGEVALPAFWRLLYREEATGAWLPVNAEIPAAKLDTLMSVKFTPVLTSALRIAVQCQENRSAGIVQWQVIAADPATVPDPKTREHPDLFLGDLSPLHAQVGWRPYKVNLYDSIATREGRGVFQAEKVCTQFLWAHANSRIEFAIPSGYTRFTGYAIGPSDLATGTPTDGADTWNATVLVDGKVLAKSEQLTRYKTREYAVDISFPAGSKKLTLITDTLGDGRFDNSFWAFPTLLTADSQKRPNTPTVTDKWPKLAASTSSSDAAPASAVAAPKPSAPQPAPPSRDTELPASRDDGEPSQIRFTNKLKEELQIQLVNSSGKLGKARRLWASRSERVPTSLGQVWVVSTKNGKRLGWVESLTEDSTALIDDSGIKVIQENPPTRESMELVSMIQFTGTNIGDAVALLRQRITEAGLNARIELDPRIDPKAGSYTLDAKVIPLRHIVDICTYNAGMRLEHSGNTYRIIPR